jgi:hypothetical protein
MRLIKDKMPEQDNDEFAAELFNDRNQPNGVVNYISTFNRVNKSGHSFMPSFSTS